MPRRTERDVDLLAEGTTPDGTALDARDKEAGLARAGGKSGAVGIRRRGASKKRLVIFAALVCAICAVAAFAPLIAPYDPYLTDYSQMLAHPSAEHLFGCDNFGRDEFSRVIYGTRVSVIMSVIAALFTMLFGTLIGIIAGLFGGWVDSVLMRISDTFLAFPEIVLGVAIVGALGPSTTNALIAIVAVMWVRFARIARGLALELKSADFIFNARQSGCSMPRIVMSHSLPNIMPHILAALVLEIGNIMLTLASFSFLGLGVQPPTPEWGAMLNDGRSYFQTAPMLMVYPGLAIFISVAIFNLFGNALDDWANNR